MVNLEFNYSLSIERHFKRGRGSTDKHILI